MKTILMGNAGAGKTTLARELANREPATPLSLDDIAFEEGATRRPLAQSVAEALRFIEAHESWIIEGCYGDLIEALLPHCQELIFLNPGIASCIAHSRQRPWEPDKFESPEDQNRNLASLVEWISGYETREDEYGLQRHRMIFDSFLGKKRELTDTDRLVFERTTAGG